MLIKKFTLVTQGATELAGRITVKHGHRYVTPAHLLLGLLGHPEAQVDAPLRAASADLDELSRALERRIAGCESAPPDAQRTPINRKLEAVFARAEEEMTRLGKRYIGVNHVLLGLLDDDECAEDLARAGADPAVLRTVLESARTGNHRGASNLGDYEFLSRFGVDLTERARNGKLDPVIGRDAEIRQVIQVLCRRLKNNPILVGEPGVGKTAIAEGLAQRIAQGNVPDNLVDHVVVALDLGALVAGTKFRGEFEERFKNLLAEVADAGNVLLFIDEIHMLVGTGGPEGGTDASNLLKPALSRGDLRCLGSTTAVEYRKRIAKDSALSRRFQLVEIAEPTTEQAITILRGLRDTYELHHAVRITDAAIHAAVRLSHRYVTDRFLPDKAIDLMDQAAATLRMELASSPEELEAIEQDVLRLEIEIRAIERDHDNQPTAASSKLRERLERRKAEAAALREHWTREKDRVFGAQEAKRELEAARRELREREARIRKGDYERPQDVGADYDRVLQLKQDVIPERERRAAELAPGEAGELRFVRQQVTDADVAEALSRATGIPAAKLLDAEGDRLMRMEELLAQRVVGQDEAVSKVARAVRRARAHMQDPNRPLASFLMLGPTGVGKTELTKALAEFMFDDERALVRVDMSEYMEKHSVARLVGAPPGYVGYEEGGVLTNQVRRKPYTVILLDEVEKAHADVFNLLLQVLDDGRLTDAQGNTVNFKNTIIIMTSNLGARAALAAPADPDAMKRTMLDAAERHFRPEFLNRLDDLIVFKQLSAERMAAIAGIQVERVAKLLQERDGALEVGEGVLEHLAERGFDPEYGARPLKRVVQSALQDPIAELIVQRKLSPGQTVRVTRTADDRLEITAA